LNNVFFLLSLVSLFLETLINQLMKPENEYTLLSRKRIGMREDNDGGAVDNSSDIDSHVSSDDDVSS